jgi:zinc protease
MFQMVWLRFDGVRRDEGLYKTYKDNQLQLVRNFTAMPEMRFSEAFVDAMIAPNPYKLRLFDPANVERMDLDRSIALYRQRFASAKDMTFILVGDFDVAQIKPLLAAYLGTLPTPDLHVGYRDVGIRPVKGVVKKEVLAGTEPKSIVSLMFSGPAAWSPAETVRMNALVEVMTLRVNSVLREKRGLIYSGGFQGGMQRIPYEHYQIGVQLPTGPEKVDQLVAALFAEIDSMRNDGPTQAELDKVKANFRQRNAKELQENEYWLYNLQGALIDGTPAANLLTINDLSEKLTVADVRAAAQRYFDKDNYVQAVLKPETGAQPAAVASK